PLHLQVVEPGVDPFVERQTFHAPKRVARATAAQVSAAAGRGFCALAFEPLLEPRHGLLEHGAQRTDVRRGDLTSVAAYIEDIDRLDPFGRYQAHVDVDAGVGQRA